MEAILEWVRAQLQGASTPRRKKRTRQGPVSLFSVLGTRERDKREQRGEKKNWTQRSDPVRKMRIKREGFLLDLWGATPTYIVVLHKRVMGSVSETSKTGMTSGKRRGQKSLGQKEGISESAVLLGGGGHEIVGVFCLTRERGKKKVLGGGSRRSTKKGK